MFKSILIVLLTSMLPIIELRGGIPLGIAGYNLPPALALIVSLAGTLLAGLILLWLWPRLVNSVLRRFKPLDRFLSWIFERTRKRFYRRYSKWGDLALVIFVAVPLPITGIWTGSVAAYLFGIPYWRAFGLLSLGALISGLIVLLATIGIILVSSFKPRKRAVPI